MAQVVGVVQGELPAADLPLDVRGAAFQQRVWQALRDIPAGETATYAQIAERVGSPKAVRAVGSACGANPVAVAIPCHRVVRRDGGLSGYRWGVERKRALLESRKRVQRSPSQRLILSATAGRGSDSTTGRRRVQGVSPVAPLLRLAQEARAVALVGHQTSEPLGLLGAGATLVGGGHGGQPSAQA